MASWQTCCGQIPSRSEHALLCGVLLTVAHRYNEGENKPSSWTYRDNRYGLCILIFILSSFLSNRGCSYHFSFKAVLDFLHSNDLFSVIRGKERRREMFCRLSLGGRTRGHVPRLPDVQSRPQEQLPLSHHHLLRPQLLVCSFVVVALSFSRLRSDDHGNKAAVLEYGLGNVMNIKQFSAVEHP